MSSTANSITVKAIPLDKLIPENHLDKINWIKIDVEGAEIDVLKGAKRILSANKNLKILLEMHVEEDFPILKQILEDFGFTIFRGPKEYNNYLYAEKVNEVNKTKKIKAKNR